jgi:hypothetical protein
MAGAGVDGTSHLFLKEYQQKGGFMVMVGIPSILGLLVLVLDIIAIVSVLQSSMDTGNKALWIILILLLPVIGMVLYFLLGKKPNSL